VKSKLLNRAIAAFRLFGEREPITNIIENIEKGVAFRGTNLWILVFAIFIASLGLNMNSTAVIIGAMLISPLMGPIMGIGLSLGINDLALLRKSLYNFLFAVLISLITSTVYFLISPIIEVQSELLARTSPTFYDVLIAFFGGLAGILALSSKQKGNVIPGVAIATALMPPLCTAGFGLATWNSSYFFGAFYLFSINTVFIAWATLLTVKLLKFPIKQTGNELSKSRAGKFVTAIVLLTLVPSIYLANRFRSEMEFQSRANNYIKNYTALDGNFLFNHDIDARKKVIRLTYGGRGLSSEQSDSLKLRLKQERLDDVDLQIKQGFSVLERKKIETQLGEIRSAIDRKDLIIHELSQKLDSVKFLEDLSVQITNEAKVNFPQVKSMVIRRSPNVQVSDSANSMNAIIGISEPMGNGDKQKLKVWLEIRLDLDSMEISFAQ
jgi:uncharacterized hydrophobic protein (TIGR00271 family)